MTDETTETGHSPTKSEPLDLEAITIRSRAAHDMVSALCKTRGTAGAREWMMTIPARPDYDPDLVIGSALIDGDRLRKAHDNLVAERDWYRSALHGVADGNFTATHAAHALAWIDAKGETAVDHLVRVNAAMVAALEEFIRWTIDPAGNGFVCDCNRSGMTQECIAHREDCPVPAARAALALAKGVPNE